MLNETNLNTIDNLDRQAADDSGDQSKLRAHYAEKIRSIIGKTVGGFVEQGAALKEAKDQLDHGHWLPLLREDLRYGESRAQRLMKIATNRNTSDPANWPFLQPVLSTLVKLTRLPDAEFKRRLASRAINPSMPCKAADLEIKKTKEKPLLPNVDKLEKQIAELAHGIQHGAINVDGEFKQRSRTVANRLHKAAGLLMTALDGPMLQ